MIAMPRLPRLPRLPAWSVPSLDDRGAAQVAADRIREVMWIGAGIARTAKGLRQCIAELDDIGSRIAAGATEEQNLLDTARLIAEAALMRKESRGGHFRQDFPREKKKWRGKHIEW
jgi:L-aspartate oxidase